jgi:hypothetical protein
MKLNATYLFLLLFITSTVYSQQIAFPTAEGAGRFTTGGRGTPTVPTTVFEVTNLDDNVSSPPVGSLRWAVTNNSPAAPYRTIVFRISGTIRLLGPLSINRANTTIAGQTAPGDGICIADYGVSLGNNNIIVRHIRFRLGDRYQNQGMVDGSGDDDAFGGLDRKNIIVDHCTMSWSSDEALTVYRGDSTTLQWNLVSEPLDYSYHFETGDTAYERHGYGGIWGGKRASFHHNLIAHLRGRAPRFDGSRNLPNSTSPVIGSENVDFRNNVIYNWIEYNVNGGEGGNYNLVSNYYKYGPNTLNFNTADVNRRSMVINPYRKTSAPVLPYGKYFLEGNHVDNSPTVTANNWLGAAMNGGSLNDTTQSKVTTPFDIAPLNTQTALQAYEAVLAGAGATLPRRDTLDERIANDVRNRTGRVIDVQGGYPHGTPFSSSQTAWPPLNSLPAPTDTDHDGMPDSWETTNGSNPNDASDRNVYASSGYTLLENYLNSITGPLPLTLLTFTAINTGKEVAANWTTTNEINTKSFSVERSVDGRTFSSIASVAAKSTTLNNNYSFTDLNPLTGTSYYRLQMIDKDGKFTYSPTAKVSRVGKMALKLNPNPVADKMVVSHDAASLASVIKVLSADGKTITAVKVTNGALQTTLNAAFLKAGVYYLVYENAGEKATIEFIKK